MCFAPPPSQVKEVSDAERALKREEMTGITDTNQVFVEVSADISLLPHIIGRHSTRRETTQAVVHCRIEVQAQNIVLDYL